MKTKQEFLQEVIDEIETIKTKATDEEKGRLDFDTFNHEEKSLCIYGQMTGSCVSQRALELMPKSYDEISHDHDSTFYEQVDFGEQDFSTGDAFTALEKYLFMVDSRIHKQIIEYIKGDISELNLSVENL